MWVIITNRHSVVEERGDEGVERIKSLTNGLGAHSVVEAVGTPEAFMQAIHSTRGGRHMSFVGVPGAVQIPGIELFFAGIHTQGGPAPVRRFPLDQAAEGYKAMDERRATKVLLTL